MSYYRKKRKMEQLLQMQAMTDPTLFFYKGDFGPLEARLDQLAMNPNAYITNAYIVILGKQVKEGDICCMVFTILLGICLIFPTFFIFCDWYKSMVNPAHQIPMSTYQKLQILTQHPNLQSLNIQIYDNGFGKEKSSFFFNLISHSPIKILTFTNSASDNNYKDNEYSDFVENVRPIKGLTHIQSSFRWFGQYLI